MRIIKISAYYLPAEIGAIDMNKVERAYSKFRVFIVMIDREIDNDDVIDTTFASIY